MGRAKTADLQLDEPVVSGFHATIQWGGHGWEIRDLGSRNGVFVNGARITGPTALSAGDRIAFGSTNGGWVLDDASPPAAFARHVDDGTEVVGTPSMLGLPDATAALASISRTPTGWSVESDQLDGVSVVDREIIEAGGRWRLHLPLPSVHTTRAASLVHLDDTTVRFLVSPDWEYIEIEVQHPAGPFHVPHFTANELLLVLAMARRDDTRQAADHGWIDFDQLTSSFRLTPMSARDQSRIRQWIHKCRRRFVELGVTDGERIVERRPGTRDVRLGAARVEIVRRHA